MLTELEDILRPRIIVCVAGAYPRGAAHALDGATARDVITITGSRACVIHVPRVSSQLPEPCIPVADFLGLFESPRDVVPLINTSRAESASEALQMIESGLRFFEDNDTFRRAALIKLEILDDELLSVSHEMLKCLAELEASVRARCIPYVRPDPDIVVRACQLGCPAIRIASGRIGRRSGVLHPDAVQEAVDAAGSVPCILEGGLNTGQDIHDCASVGARAVLINSAFALAQDPREKARELRAAADDAWSGLS